MPANSILGTQGPHYRNTKVITYRGEEKEGRTLRILCIDVVLGAKCVSEELLTSFYQGEGLLDVSPNLLRQ